jgi:hypothetical protein
VIDCIKKKTISSSKAFDDWVINNVKFESYKVNLEIDKYFGKSIWLVRAGHHTNYFNLYGAGIRIFSGLFHINRNLNYSVI